MSKASPKTLKKIIEMVIKLKIQNINVPLMIWGTHGIGKTQIVREVAKSMGYDCVVLNMANIPIEDATGFPIRDNDEMIYIAPAWFKKKSTEPILYFCDEINRAPKYVLQGLFNFINEGRIHDHSIKKNDVLICAANPDNEKYDVTNFIDDAWESRFAHIMYEPEINDILHYFEDKNSVVHNFIKTNGELVLNPITTNISEKRVNPRSLERISQIMNYADSNEEFGKDFSEYGIFLCSALIGDDAGSLLFRMWKENFDMPPIKKILQMKKIPYSQDEIDKFSVINAQLVKYCIESCDFKTENLNLTQEEIDGIIRYINYQYKDYQVSFFKELSFKEMEITKGKMSCTFKLAVEFTKQLYPEQYKKSPNYYYMELCNLIKEKNE